MVRASSVAPRWLSDCCHYSCEERGSMNCKRAKSVPNFKRVPVPRNRYSSNTSMVSFASAVADAVSAFVVVKESCWSKKTGDERGVG